jgi:hypothetical protein
MADGELAQTFFEAIAKKCALTPNFDRYAL